MSRVAIATCVGADDPDSRTLLDALALEGVEGELAVWDDGAADWRAFDLVVIRSTWDYAPRRDEFLEWARTVERLVNPYEVVRYSTDKHYLADLAARGQRVIPSTFCDVGEEAVWPDGAFVVKPCVGAGSIDAERYGFLDHELALRHVRHLHDAGRDVVIQPYVESVDEVGERALIFIGGSFSHAMTKKAMLNVAHDARDVLFRREQMSLAVGEPDAIAFAQSILDNERFADLLYARVDVVTTPDGWALMELELVEPSLFLDYDSSAAGRLARAIVSRLA